MFRVFYTDITEVMDNSGCLLIKPVLSLNRDDTTRDRLMIIPIKQKFYNKTKILFLWLQSNYIQILNPINYIPYTKYKAEVQLVSLAKGSFLSCDLRNHPFETPTKQPPCMHTQHIDKMFFIRYSTKSSKL